MPATRQLNNSVFMSCCLVAENYANKIKCGRKIVMVAEVWPNFSEISGREMVEENLNKSFFKSFFKYES